MKKNQKIIIFISALVVLGLIGLLIFLPQGKGEENKISNEKEKQIEKKKEEEKKEIQEIKEETGASGKEDIYELQEETDGRKVLTIKPSIQYQVALAGAILRRVPNNLEEAQKIASENELTKQGIWLPKDDRDTFLEWLNEIGNTRYGTTDDGYLMVREKGVSPNEVDQKMDQILAKNRSVTITISGVLMTVDSLTGEMMDNPFAQMDSYQPYDYVKDENRMVLSLSDNRKGKLTHQEILMSVISLLETE